MTTPSIAQLGSRLTPELKKQWLESLTPLERDSIRYYWREIHAREEQLAPVWSKKKIAERGTDWRNFAVIAGRGFGKTRIGSEWIREIKEFCPRIALVGETAADVRDVMIQGESGILACSPPWDRPVYNPSARILKWANGTIAQTFSAEEPDSLRGPQFHAAWCDEPAKFRYIEDVWSNLQMCLRLGDFPRTLLTTTPRPTKFIKRIMGMPSTHVTRGSTYANKDNMPASFFQALEEQYAGTRIGRQEIYGEIVEDITGALWTFETIQRNRVKETPDLHKIVVGVDPSGSKEGDECGIVGAGYSKDTREVYVLADDSQQASAQGWSEAAVFMYDALEADLIVVESNYGGDMTERTLRVAAEDVFRQKKPNPRTGQPIRSPLITVVRIASTKAKAARAAPVAQLYEQNRAKHMGEFLKLETEMREFTVEWNRQKDKSPNRVDALVFAVRECSDFSGKRSSFRAVS